MSVIDFIILSCTVIFTGTIVWELISLSDVFILYIESVTAKNKELARLYGIMSDKQALLYWQEEVRIKSEAKKSAGAVANKLPYPTPQRTIEASTPQDNSVKGGDV